MKQRTRAILASSGAFLVAFLAYGGLIEARRVVLERVEIPGDGPRLLVAQISDVNFDGIGPRERRVREILHREVNQSPRR